MTDASYQKKKVVVRHQADKGQVVEIPHDLEVILGSTRGNSGKLFGAKGLVLGVVVHCCNGHPIILDTEGTPVRCPNTQCGYQYAVQMKGYHPVVRYEDTFITAAAAERREAHMGLFEAQRKAAAAAKQAYND